MAKDSVHFHIEKGFPSLNKFYSTPHWTYRSRMKTTYVTIFQYMIKEQSLPKISSYLLELESHFRMDLDNCIMIIKFFNDALKSLGLIEDDRPSVFKGFSIRHNDSLTKNTGELVLHYNKRE